MPTCSAVLTPFYFKKDLGNKEKQIKFNAYVEQLYLHSKYYHKQEDVLKELDVKPKEYVIVRYIAYDAHHDLKAHPLSEECKKMIVSEIAKRYRVFVSLEKGVNDPFYDKYTLKISPEKMHDLEANAKFMVAEGATMASESFVLGVPYLYLNPLKVGYIDYQCSNYPDMCFMTTDGDKALEIIHKLMNSDNDGDAVRKEVEKQTINPTEYLEWFVERFPSSKRQKYPVE
jgi:predicted glycosyltransferase